MERFKNYVIWTQSSLTSDEDILAVDGRYLFSDTGDELFAYLSVLPRENASPWNIVFDTDKSIKIGKNGSVSNSLSVYQNNDGCTLIKSLFQEKDETGRKIAYLFCCPSLDLKIVETTLKDAALFIGRTPNPADLAIIGALSYKKYIKLFGLLILFFVLIVVLLFVIYGRN